MLCIAHRGASGYEPENTLRAFKRALDFGAPWIELDVYAVEDQLVVFHDDELGRTTNGSGRIYEQTFDYIRSLDAGRGERIPTLEEVLDLVDRRAGVNIELKGKATVLPSIERVDEAVRNGGWTFDRFIFSSFDHDQLRIVAEHRPDLRVGVLYPRLHLRNKIDIAKSMGAYSIHLALRSLRPGLVDEAHRSGLKVFVYTVNEPADIQRMATIGVDGVFSDYPDRVLAHTDSSS